MNIDDRDRPVALSIDDDAVSRTVVRSTLSAQYLIHTFIMRLPVQPDAAIARGGAQVF